MEELKICKTCGCAKTLNNFQFRSDSKTYRGDCKQCRKEYLKKWENEHAEQCRASRDKWKKEHPEQCRASATKWRKGHLKQVNENRRKYRAEHPNKISDKRKEYQQLYRSNHKSYFAQKVREYQKTPKGRITSKNAKHNRRARKKGGKITLAEWTAIKEQQHFRCYWCKVKFKDEELTMDHVISLKRGGLHDTSNIVASCMPCNSNKGTKHWSLI
jgi:5-methylcytosine-specific restriction endonuclease McrA